jgi:hypothetical protein
VGIVGTALAVLVAVVVVVVLPDGGPPHPDHWDPRVSDLVAFVERERGLRFEQPVYVDFLTPAEYSRRVRTEAGDVTSADRTQMDDTVSILRALGLASGKVDLLAANNDLADSGTLAFYDPRVERVIVRGTEMTVALRVTLAHELTHALQDQHFDLEKLQNDIYARADASTSGDDDAAAARARNAADTAFAGYQALVEGDAVRVENAYVDSLTSAERDEYVTSYQSDLDQADADLSDVPAALRAFQGAPYVLGQPLVDLVHANGGNTAVDHMFSDLPSTQEQMLDPLTYIDDQKPSPLGLPEEPRGAGVHTVDEGTMGAVELYIVLAERIDPLVALDAADGWANAQFVAYRDRDLDRTCVRVVVDGDTPRDDQQMHDALTAWVAAAPEGSDAVIEDVGLHLKPGQTQFRSCDPGTDGHANKNRGLDALTVPAVRSHLAIEAAGSGVELDQAWQAGDCFVHQLTFDQIVAINDVTDQPSPEQQALLDHAFAACSPTPA